MLSFRSFSRVLRAKINYVLFKCNVMFCSKGNVIKGKGGYVVGKIISLLVLLTCLLYILIIYIINFYFYYPFKL